jgi:hypothetical protein
MSIEAMNEAWYLEKQKNPHTAFNSWCRGYEAGVEAIEQAEKQFNPNWDQQAVLVERIRELEAQLYGQAEKQEPVAWMYVNVDGECEQIEYGACDYDDPSITFLYTAPPRKEWVELNLDDVPDVFVGDISFCQGAKWAQAKLKEKNT